MAKVIPIYKKDDSAIFGNYRPLSILPANNIARTNGILVNRLRHFLAPGILVNIYNCLILPHLYYGVLVWGYERTRIFKVQK